MSSTLLLVILSILGWGVGSLFYKAANDRMEPVLVEAVATCVYVVLTPLQFWLFKPVSNWNTPAITYSVLGALCMAVGSLTYFYLLQRGGAGQTTAMTSVYPALTLLLSYLFLGEALSFRKIMGVSLAFVSVYLLSKK